MNDANGDEMKISNIMALRPIFKMVTENQDISRTAMQLTSIMMAIRPEINEFLNSFHNFDELWATVSWKEYLNFVEHSKINISVFAEVFN